MFSVEYLLDIVSLVCFVIFYDVGFVNVGFYDFNFVYYNDNFGFGFCFFVVGVLFSFDFGIFFMMDKDNDKGNQFNFFFGIWF